MKLLIIGCCLSRLLFAQDEIDLSTQFNINVEPEKPRVQMFNIREKPKFPEIPISKSFFNQIIDRDKNYNYKLEQLKIIVQANINEELTKLK